MVYDKTRSGDPDYDDKQPPEFHAGGPVVTAGDGQEVRLSRVNGPVDAEGAHVNLAVDTTDLDNRPSPGNVASAPSEVQDYSAEDTPTTAREVQADSKDVEAIKAGQAGVRANAEASGRVDTKVVTDDQDTATPAPAKAVKPQSAK